MGLVSGIVTDVELLSAIVGFIAISTLFPRLSVDSSLTTDPRHPLKTVFTVSNDGVFPIFNVFATCWIDMIRTARGTSIEDLGVQFEGSGAHRLSPNGKMSLPFDQVLGGVFRFDPLDQDFVEARVTVKVTFRPALAWWHREKQFPLKAKRTSDGSWLWTRLAN